MIWHLAPDVFAAPVGEDLVFLDLPRGRYLCLPGGGAQLTADRGLAVDDDLGAELAQAGLASRDPATAGLVERPVPAPAHSIGPDLRPRAPLRRILNSLCDAAGGYLGRPLPALVGAAARDRPTLDPPVLTGGAAAQAAAFQGWAPFMPLPPKCLLRAWLLLRHLRRRGEDAVWVFGVRTWPFQAHCWLQVQDTVLDDHWERVAAYSPILAI